MRKCKQSPFRAPEVFVNVLELTRSASTPRLRRAFQELLAWRKHGSGRDPLQTPA